MAPTDRERMSWPGLVTRLGLRSIAHPKDGMELLRVLWRFRRRRWYRRFPFLPLPASDYVRWRMLTAYGEHGAVPPTEDLVRYARWATRK